jgi:DNA-binding beta-propeller fold protein YncE
MSCNVFAKSVVTCTLKVLSVVAFFGLFQLCLSSAADSQTNYTSPLSTGVRLDPVGEFIDLGSVPLGMALSPDGSYVAVVLSGWREQGLQIVDLKSRKVTQTLEQPAAFLGAAFARDGKHLYVSGGNDDSIFVYSWENGAAKFERKIVLGQQKPDKTGSRYPAGMALSPRGNLLYVAENVGDSLAVVNPESGQVVQRLRTDHYPYSIELAADEKVSVSAWGADTVAIFKMRKDGKLKESGKVVVGRHPSAMVSNKSGSLLFVALAGSDEIAVVDTKEKKIIQRLSDAAPGGPSEGSTPNAMALSADGSKLLVAEANNNSIAVFDVAQDGSGKATLAGRIPTDWYPASVLFTSNQILVVCGKGHGSHANPDGPIPAEPLTRRTGYDLGQLNGSLRILGSELNSADLAERSRRVSVANNWGEPRKPKSYPAFKHVIYIIKENRTYDQVFGDLKEGDGDPSLVFFGQQISPNHHALALRFGLFDRFFTNSEVSSQGHMWSTAAYVTDYDEKTVHSAYSDRRAGDDEEIDEPGNGFLWNLAQKKGISFRDYGEMVNDPKSLEWASTKRRGLADHINLAYPPFNLAISDQVRADAWLAEFKQFVEQNNLPQLEILHLPNDHTAGGHEGMRTPKALMADNDLALGRIIEALSHSPYWKDTVVFVLEDDSQAGPDHVDSHRSPAFVISAFNHPGRIHRFANTTDVIAAMEDILNLDRMSKFDYFSRSLADVFSDRPDLTPYTALVPQQDMNEMNPRNSAAGEMSKALDFSKPDRIDDDVFNRILWRMMKGDETFPVVGAKSPMHALVMAR